MLGEVQRDREQEPEPRQLERDIASLRHIRELKVRREQIYGKPRVLQHRKGRKEPHGRDKIPYEPIEEWGLPMYTMRHHVSRVKPEGYGYEHRHFFEAIFYILEGSGYEIHDGHRYEWKAGDCMAVPPYTVHRHFNPNPKDEAVFFIVIPIVHGFLGLEQYEEYDFPTGTTPDENYLNEMGMWGEDFANRILDMRAVESVPGLGSNEYDAQLQALIEENRRLKSVSHVITPDDALPWENTRMGRIKYMVHPKLRDKVMTQTLDLYLQEIPPGSRSGKHIHFAEELHYILEGTGYDIQDGSRYDWEQGDVVAVPVLTEHQHFNADADKPTRFVSVMPATYRSIGHGGIRHLEDAPEWRTREA